MRALLSVLIQAGVLFALLLMNACARPGEGSATVEAPVVSVDASAAAIALVRDPSPVDSALEEKPGDAPFRAGDRWVGHYNCMQGKTDLVLVFEELGPSASDERAVVALFEFHYDGANVNAGYAAADGVARMRGRFDPKTRRLTLKGEEWIDQPPNYRLVNLVGIISKAGTYSGTVEGPGCTTFFASPEKNTGSLPRSLPRPTP